ncbi:hypothetical protein PVAG01_02358 [Phlyctema vagabunda]|uniref:Uncharacterized protein n=1 Tax=Phlyctema vagabunda TaxID=108571 RepID=A0ABR4PQE0_9HELO
MAQYPITERILAASSQNSSLLTTLSQTDHAPSALQQTNLYLQNLQSQIDHALKDLQEISRKVAAEFKDHKKYRDSTMRRLAYKMGRRSQDFSEKAEKEEREYFEAVEVEFKAKRDLEGLKRSLEESKKQKSDLEGVAQVHAATQKELDALYSKIFDGPTPDIAGEDEKENAVREAQQVFDTAMSKLNTESQVQGLLIDAQKFLDRAEKDVHDALSASDMDLWGVGGSFADMQERSALSSAQNHCSQVEMLISQARRLSPHVRDFPPINIAKGNFMSDIVFDNIFSDMAFHDKIEDSRMQIMGAKRELKTEVITAGQRRDAVKQEVDGKGAVLGSKRRELQDVRAAAFERIAGGLPAYEA